MISVTSRDDLHKLFPIQSKSFQTDGFQDGVVIRFKTFYLKIYDDKFTYAYHVQGYRYNEQHPVFEECVPVSKFRKFASRFTNDDYLHGFCKHSCCGHHQCPRH